MELLIFWSALKMEVARVHHTATGLQAKNSGAWKSNNIICSCLALIVTVTSAAQKTGDNSSTLWYEKPATAWEEALPLGNGRTGAMVFGGVVSERIQLNDHTLWSGYPQPGNNPDGPKYLPLVRAAVDAGDYALAASYWKKMQGPYSARYLHMAGLTLDFDPRDSVAPDYRRSLDLRTAISTTSYTTNRASFNREIFVSHPDSVLVMRLSTGKRKSISFQARLKSKLRFRTRTQLRALILDGKAPMHVANRESEPLQIVYDDWGGEGMNFSIHMTVMNEGGTVNYTDSLVSVSGANAVTILLAAATSFNGFDKSPGLNGKEAAKQAAATLARAVKKSYAELKQAHIADYQSLFNRVSLDLGSTNANLPTDQRMLRFNRGEADPDLVELYYQYGRYLLIACSRPGSMPANLQGIWNDHVQPPWGSNYTTNINTEMNYWLAESTNLTECHEPLFSFLRALAVNGAVTAATNYGITQGWCAHHNSDVWAKSSPPGGYEWDPRSQPRWSCWPMAGAWMSTHLWEHYLFTGDAKFLRERAWPVMKGASEFLLAWLVEDKSGYLVTNPSTSPENTIKIDGREFQIAKASTMDMAIARELFIACIRAAEILDTDAGFRAKLEEAYRKLYPYHIGKHGQLQEWFMDWDDPRDTHRHLSHLFGLHPGSQVTPGGTPELAAA
ncbi:MAG TPA: glycoside hydrolase family 95 protein, partial [Chryseosolibacter sp.]|nr:glycoside hydrolase family 95 protein [Chryseosolibacter sp.]